MPYLKLMDTRDYAKNVTCKKLLRRRMMRKKDLDELIAKYAAGETLEEVIMSAYSTGWCDGSKDIFDSDYDNADQDTYDEYL